MLCSALIWYGMLWYTYWYIMITLTSQWLKHSRSVFLAHAAGPVWGFGWGPAWCSDLGFQAVGGWNSSTCASRVLTAGESSTCNQDSRAACVAGLEMCCSDFPSRENQLWGVKLADIPQLLASSGSAAVVKLRSRSLWAACSLAGILGSGHLCPAGNHPYRQSALEVLLPWLRLSRSCTTVWASSYPVLLIDLSSYPPCGWQTCNAAWKAFPAYFWSLFPVSFRCFL